MRTRRVALPAISAAVFVLSLVTAPPVTADDGAPTPAPTWTYTPDEPIPPGDVVARSIGESVSVAEAERRLRADGAASVVGREARIRWPESFAGLWIDHDPYRINVAFTAGAGEKVAALAERFPYPHDLRAVTADVSLETLTALWRALIQERGLLQNGAEPAAAGRALTATGGRFDLDLDVAAGHVVVQVAEATEGLREELRLRFGGRVVLSQGPLLVPRACAITNCWPAMMGGLRLEIGTTSFCSSAFAAYNKTYPSTRYLLSAGHCTANFGDTYRSHSFQPYGRVTKYTLTGTDAERVANQTDATEVSKFFVAGEYPRMVSSVMPYASMEKGAYLGKTGAKTATTRGYITSLYVAPSYVSNPTQMVMADMCSDEGDSGGAVWKQTVAYGILSGGVVGSCRDANGVMRPPRTPDEGPTAFSALSYAANALNVALIYGANLPPRPEFTYSCTFTSCAFDGQKSADEDGGVAQWSWDLGDGQYATGNVDSHNHTTSRRASTP